MQTLTKWVRPTYLPCIPLGDNRSSITACDAHIQLSRKAATEGAVLLKNDRNTLPLKKGTKVAIFGKGQIAYINCGGGSGTINPPYVRNIYEGFKMKEDKLDVFDALSLYYEEYVEAQYKEGVSKKEMMEAPLPKEFIERAKAYADTAIIVISRFSEENIDRRNDGTDAYFYLSDMEQNMVQSVTENFANVIVLLNVGAMIDTSWFAYNEAIASAIMIGQGGMEGGLAAADLITGDATPSGRLVDTCAQSFDDYPSSEGFHESDDYVKYTEDIFVGYRYFETIPGKKDRVVYPFGYGLSYTTFTYSNMTAHCTKETIAVSVTVTNTGNMAGKEVVQVYYDAPEGKLTKPSRELCGFAKTKELAPGESQTIWISFATSDMASFDDMGVIEKSCFILEKGIYRFYVGCNVREAILLEDVFELSENVITERLHSYAAPEKLDKRLCADGTYEMLKCEPVERASFPCTYKCADKPEQTYMLLDVANGKVDLDTFIAQLTDDELIHLVGGQPRIGVSDTCGMGALPRLGIPAVMTEDGPAGVRICLDRCIRTTAFPVATCIAQSWNLELMEAIGRAGALEAKENNLSIWLTPALNIHRSPLCGRNFEYFSEDPFVSGKMAAAKVRGIQSQNIVATVKHFACNNKETNRHKSDSIVSERALREIYLKGFEICVKEAKPQMIMTAYNLLNGIYTSENAELLMGILRSEWGYQGMVTTDWANLANHGAEVLAGNDIRMPAGASWLLKQCLDEKKLTREELCVCVKRILEMILWLD